MKTYQQKTSEVERKWLVIDAEGAVLGRLAATVATLLRGKHRPTYTPNIDCGDCVVIINAEKVKLTGHKLTGGVFQYHTGHPGGLKEVTPKQTLDSKYPERLIERAVERMIKRTPLGRKQMGNLKLYKGATHPHAAQSPVVFDFAARNPKNNRAA